MNLPWYKDGLKFKCTECGKCCTGGPGVVWITEEEIHEMAALLKISIDAFIKTYTRQVNGRLSLKECVRQGMHDCIFLKDKKCLVYQARPKQCRTYPWWVSNLKDEAAWREEAKHCEGIREDAPLVPLEQIQEALHQD